MLRPGIKIHHNPNWSSEVTYRNPALMAVLNSKGGQDMVKQGVKGMSRTMMAIVVVVGIIVMGIIISQMFGGANKEAGILDRFKAASERMKEMAKAQLESKKADLGYQTAIVEGKNKLEEGRMAYSDQRDERDSDENQMLINQDIKRDELRAAARESSRQLTYKSKELDAKQDLLSQQADNQRDIALASLEAQSRLKSKALDLKGQSLEIESDRVQADRDMGMRKLDIKSETDRKSVV